MDSVVLGPWSSVIPCCLPARPAWHSHAAAAAAGRGACREKGWAKCVPETVPERNGVPETISGTAPKPRETHFQVNHKPKKVNIQSPLKNTLSFDTLQDQKHSRTQKLIAVLHVVVVAAVVSWRFVCTFLPLHPQFFHSSHAHPAVSNNTKLQVNHKDQGPSPPHFSLLLRVTADRTECAIAMN